MTYIMICDVAKLLCNYGLKIHLKNAIQAQTQAQPQAQSQHLSIPQCFITDYCDDCPNKNYDLIAYSKDLKKHVYIKYNIKKNFWMLNFKYCTSYKFEPFDNDQMFQLIIQELNGCNNLSYLFNTFLLTDVNMVKYLALIQDNTFLILDIRFYIIKILLKLDNWDSIFMIG